MKPRILFVGQVGESLPPLYAGVPKRALMLAKIWKRMGAEVALVFTFHHNHEDDLGAQAKYFFEYPARPRQFQKVLFFIKQLTLHPVLGVTLLKECHKVFNQWKLQELLYVAYGLFLEDVVADFKPDIVVAESGLLRSFFASYIASWHGIPFVVETYAEVHDHSVMKFRNPEIRDRYWRTLFANASLVIAPSEYCACGPLEYVPKEKVKMIYATTLEVDVFEHDIRTQAEGRAHYKLPNSIFFIIAVGSFSPRKGHDHIVSAVALLRDKGYDVGAILCGEGAPQWLQDLAEKLGIAKAVYFFQNLSEADLRLLYKSADLYCDASNTPRACLGIALTEGLASSLPTIAYAVAGLPEVVGDTRYLVRPNDIQGIANVVEHIMGLSAQERAQIGQRNLERAKSLFDLQTIALQLFETLQSLIAQHEKTTS